MSALNLVHAWAVAAVCSVSVPNQPPEVAGRWIGEMPAPGQVHNDRFQVDVETRADGAVSASFDINGRAVAMQGGFAPDTGRLDVTGSVDGVPVSAELTLQDGRLIGRIDRVGQWVDVTLTRPPVDAPPVLEVDPYADLPVTVTMTELSDELGEVLTDALEGEVFRQRAVGVSMAVAIGGAIRDLRSIGFEDYHAGVPASDKTMYRWASIAKPLTAVVALMLAGEGRLDLDADVREYVPEFPEKEHPVTSRQLLCHQSGVVHYRRMRIRTPREYDVDHPWADRILALDMFNESDLLFEPGERYHYSTPAYSLLGAVIQRTGGDTYAAQVRERVCVPLGMETMRPDYMWEEIPHRSRGYHRDGAAVVQSSEDDISWKLPAGGWISTVGDLARFGIGLASGDLLEERVRDEMNTEQIPRSGESTGMGLGIGVGELRGLQTLSHSGGQNKTSTFLLVLPGREMAVAVMCNTSGTRWQGLAREVMEELLDAADS